MSKDIIVIVTIWVLAIIASILFIPRHRLAEAIFVYILANSFTWINALIHLELGLISFPVREFPKATDLSATLDYFGYPLLMTLYVLYEPKTKWLYQLLYMAIWVSGLVASDQLLVRYTNLVKYDSYSWYWTWLDFFIIFLCVRLITKWFFRRVPNVT